MNLNKSIFKSYDIRGIYPEDLNEQTAKLIAVAYLEILQEKTGKKANELSIVAGRDIRKSSEPLMQSALEVLVAHGVNVTNVGLISINDIYFATGFYKFDGGMIATASHNPPAYGGFKLPYLDPHNDKAMKFINGKEILDKISASAQPVSDLENLSETPKHSGKILEKNIQPDHLAHILSFIKTENLKPFKVVFDTGNGMNSLLLPEIIKKLPIEAIPLFYELDSDFPNRNPNPLGEGATDKLAAKVIAEKADFGFIFDVDGDRVFMVDEKGELVRGDMVLLLIARQMILKNPGAGIVYNLICSHAVPDLITGWGGRAIRSEVGYLNLARHMKEAGALMSGEVSGHFAFRDNYFADSAFIAMLLALSAIAVENKKLSEIIKDYQLYAKSDELNFTVADRESKLNQIREKYKENIKDEIDGLTVEFSDWWFNARPSNTEPLLRVTIEAKNQEELKKRVQEVMDVIND